MSNMVRRQGRIYYNGFEFNGPLNSAKVTARVLPDRTGRTGALIEYELVVEAVITYDEGSGDPDAGVDGYVNNDTQLAEHRIDRNGNASPQTVRNRLLEYGGELIYEGRGIGDIHINDGNEPDVEWGPKPELAEFNLIGFDKAVEVVWKCRWRTSECHIPQSGSKLGRIMEIGYSLVYTVNRRGFTRRSIAGGLRIANNRIPNPGGQPANRWAFNIDNYREIVEPAVPLRFRRTERNWEISEDKSMASFSFTDEELESPNAYPDGIVELDISHTVSMSRSLFVFQASSNRISGRVTSAPQYPVSLAWEKAYLIIRERILSVRAQGKAWPLLMDFSITENIFDREVSFSITYRALPLLAGQENKVATMFSRDFWRTHGLFRPTATNWETWKLSMGGVWSARGYAGLRHNATTADRITNLCLDDPRYQNDTQDLSPYQFADAQTLLGCSPPPAKEDSYIQHVSWLTADSENKLVSMNPLQPPSLRTGESFDYEGTQKDNSESNNSGLARKKARESIVMEIAQEHSVLFFEGYGIRVGYEVEVPKITEHEFVANERISETFIVGKQRVQRKQIGTYGGCPVFAAKWKFMLVPKDGKRNSNEISSYDGNLANLGRYGLLKDR